MKTQILDIDGEKLPNVELINFEFSKPFVIKDILRKKEKTPEIIVYEDLNILKEVDFLIYGKDLDENQRWAKRQRYALFLKPLEAPVEKNFKKLLRLPVKHYIEVDVANLRIRLTGDFVDLKEKGVWQYY